jgi:hypothetical protein
MENIILNYLSDKIKIFVSFIKILPVVQGEKHCIREGQQQLCRLKNSVFGFGADKISP